jgi:purine-binding chemotaxis protein CheW
MSTVQPQQDNSSSPVKLFLFELDGELFAVSVETVERVMKIPPITPIPNTPPAILGLFHLRGQVVVVLDLVSRMHMERARPLTANFLFVIARGRDRFAVLVDHPRTIVEVGAQDVSAPDPLILARVPAEYIQGVFLYDDSFVTRKKERQIMFGPAGVNPGNKEERVTVKRPVLWLSVERLLDHADFSALFASQRK